MRVAALVNSSHGAHPLANGIADLGGATLDLGGGCYSLGAPLARLLADRRGRGGGA